jgi:hypothetical protein
VEGRNKRNIAWQQGKGTREEVKGQQGGEGGKDGGGGEGVYRRRLRKVERVEEVKEVVGRGQLKRPHQRK